MENDEVNYEEAEHEAEGLPEVATEVLQKLDEEAAVEELERLKKLGILERLFLTRRRCIRVGHNICVRLEAQGRKVEEKMPVSGKRIPRKCSVR